MPVEMPVDAEALQRVREYNAWLEEEEEYEWEEQLFGWDRYEENEEEEQVFGWDRYEENEEEEQVFSWDRWDGQDQEMYAEQIQGHGGFGRQVLDREVYFRNEEWYNEGGYGAEVYDGQEWLNENGFIEDDGLFDPEDLALSPVPGREVHGQDPEDLALSPVVCGQHWWNHNGFIEEDGKFDPEDLVLTPV